MAGATSFTRFLRILALGFFMGLNADLLLGAQVSPQSLVDAGLDSQNRFYGTAFMVYGALLLLVASDLVRYGPVLRCLLWVFFAAGLARFLSVYFYGWPPLLITLLFAVEVIGPPVVLLWFSKLEK